MFSDVVVTIGTLQLLEPTYVVGQIEGLEAPAYRVSQYDNPGESGSTVGSVLYGGRVITISGAVISSGPAVHMRDRRVLAGSCTLNRDSNGFPVPTRLSLTTPDGAGYFVDGYVSSFKNTWSSQKLSTFTVSFNIPDPGIYGSVLATTGLIGRRVGGGVKFPLVFPLTFAGGNPGVGTLQNAGTIDTFPLIYIRGAAVNPRLYSIERGLALALSFTTANASDVITIDMKSKTVVLNGSTSLLQYKASDSSWFSAQPGVNSILFTTGSGGDTATMEATAYPSYLGL